MLQDENFVLSEIIANAWSPLKKKNQIFKNTIKIKNLQ